MGASIFRNLCCNPFHAETKKPLAEKNKTGSDKPKLSQVKTSFNPCCSIFPDEKYSGKLNIIILEKQKPATPILYILCLLKRTSVLVLVSLRLI